MNREERRISLAYFFIGIALACCIAGFIALRRDQIGAGVVFMASMFAMAVYGDHILGSIPDRRKYDKQLRLVEDEE